MEDRGWRIEDRGWRMEDGGWRMEDGGWRMEDRGWRMEDRGWRIEDRGWRIDLKNGPCSVCRSPRPHGPMSRRKLLPPFAAPSCPAIVPQEAGRRRKPWRRRACRAIAWRRRVRSGRAISPLSAAPDFANSSRFRSADPVGRDSRRAMTSPTRASIPLRHTASNRRSQTIFTIQNSLFKIQKSGPCRNFRPHDAPKISPTSAAPGKPMA